MVIIMYIMAIPFLQSTLLMILSLLNLAHTIGSMPYIKKSENYIEIFNELTIYTN